MPNGEMSLIIRILEKHCQCGNSYMCRNTLLHRCLAEQPRSSRLPLLSKTLDSLIDGGQLQSDGNDIYLKETWEDEEFVAHSLSKHLWTAPDGTGALSREIRLGEIVLNEDQLDAIVKVQKNGLTLITGGAGSGKSTVARALIDVLGVNPNMELVLCAPTGKAARNLSDTTGYPAGTIHKVLHMLYNGRPQVSNVLDGKKLIIVDEAGMMSLHVFSELLRATPEDCRIVLLGDQNQLQGIGAGNVLIELLKLGLPNCKLRTPYRQKNTVSALYYNVAHFSEIRKMSELQTDESFQIQTGTDDDIRMMLLEEAVRQYRAERTIRVITPRREGVPLSAAALSRLMQGELNPLHNGIKTLTYGKTQFRDGDLVMVTANDAVRGCFNGDIAVFRIHETECSPRYDVLLQNGSCASWTTEELHEKRLPIELAYAMTVHKSQGSGYSTVLIPLSTEQMSNMLNRNLFYTAISRAKESVILYASGNAVEQALQTIPAPRCSNLAKKARKLMYTKQQ